MKRSRATIGIAAVTTTLASVAAFTVAPAANAATASEPIATGLAGPLQMDVEGDRVVVAQNFIGVLSEVNADGTPEELFKQTKGEVAGVAIEGEDVAFLTTQFSHKNPASFLKLLHGDGSVDKIANLYEYEADANPDGTTRYGFRDLSKKCKAKVPKYYSYKGIVESHPYGLADAPGGGWYVADAAANAILYVAPDGTVDLLSVMPTQPHVVTAKQAEAEELPKCVAGHAYHFEAVPTDVEVDEGGELVVSLLPGGPEGDALGARGSVVRINPDTGVTTVLAGELAGATNVAVDGTDVYVSQLFGGQISKIASDGTVSSFFEAKQPAALEWADGKLYAAIKVFNQKQGGSIVAITP